MKLLGFCLTRRRRQAPHSQLQVVIDRVSEELKFLSRSMGRQVPHFRSEKLILDMAYRYGAGAPCSIHELFARLEALSLRAGYPGQSGDMPADLVRNVCLRVRRAISIERSLVEGAEETIVKFKDFLNGVSPGDF